MRLREERWEYKPEKPAAEVCVRSFTTRGINADIVRLDADKAIVWFDIDNTLYSAKHGVEERMRENVHDYLVSLGLDDAEATALRMSYYKTYGLVLRGLLLHHNIDALDYDKRCNQSVPLEQMLSPDPIVRRLLLDLDRTKVRVWAFTNAYVEVRKERTQRIYFDWKFAYSMLAGYSAFLASRISLKA